MSGSDLKQDLIDFLCGSRGVELRNRVVRATIIEPPEPTDAELRSLLQAALPAEWVVSDCGRPGECIVRTQADPTSHYFVIGYPQYAVLRKEGGVERCARALRVLTGEITE